MGFLGVYRAVYDYAPQGEGELEITEGDLLLVLEKSTDDDWWKAKKKATSDDDDEPEGLIPNNYIEEAHPIQKAKALYDYTNQTEEEIAFTEDAQLDVYDLSDPDWTLVGYNGEFGFAPAIYIEVSDGSTTAPAAPPMPSRHQAQQPTPEPEEEEESPLPSPAQNPAKALAGIIAQRTGGSSHAPPPISREPEMEAASPPLPSRSQPVQYTPEESEEEQAPPMPRRVQSPESEQYSAPPPPRIQEPEGVKFSPPYNRAVSDKYDEDQPMSQPGGYRLYSIHEMVSSLGKNKKMPITLGLNLGRGMIMIAPAKSRDGPQQEWTADRLTHYSIEGKHVFLEMVRPSKSADFHAGSKDTAQEIVSQLGELAGASRAEGLREVMAASSGQSGGQKQGHMLYEFMAQGDDEVTVAVGDEIVVLDDSQSEEWWKVRRLKNGKEGVVPSSYVEITGTLPVPQTTSYAGVNPGRSPVEQNRMEEERMTKEAAKKHRRQESEARAVDDGNGVRLPDRQSSLAPKGHDKRASTQKKREAPKTKPNMSRVRTWTDRSGAFRVEAEFLGLKDNKIHLHKDNGVKIAVPVGKMAVEDLEYVESMTGVSLDEDKPLSDIKRRNTQRDKERQAKSANGISTKGPEYDWFDFFLASGVNPQICERYAQNFSRDQMGEEVLPEVTPALLRTLGLKEGDILRVMKYLDAKFGRTNGATPDGDASSSGLFSGPGGALRNNTRKGRPAPAVETNDVISAESLKAGTGGEGEAKSAPSAAAETPIALAPPPISKTSGFDDDAWSVKPVRSPTGQAPPKAPSPTPTPTAATPAAPKLTGSMNELSLLSPALEPTPAATLPQPIPTQATAPAAPQEQPKPSADPSFFNQLGAPAAQNILSQPTGRQRPQAPALNTTNSSIAPPPRSASAPGYPNQQQSAFGPPPTLQPQYTGYQQSQPTGFQAPQGQSLQNLQQQRTMTMNGNMLPPQQMPYQQNGGLMPQPTGYGNMISPQMTGYYPQQQQYMTGQPTGSSPFADPPRPPFQPTPTGMQQSYSPNPAQFQSPSAGLPPALTPMRTGMTPNGGFGMQPQQTGFGGQPSPGFPPQQQMPQQQMPPQQMPPGMQNGGMGMQNGGMGMQQTGGLAPLMPQKTGPPPPVRFGVAGGAKPLVATPTGRRANLSNATPQNPFGF